MTASRHEADDLSQEAIARALEREETLAHRDSIEGWLFRIATNVCLDSLRHRAIERRVNALADPLDEAGLPPFADAGPDPEAAAIRRDDVRFAIVVALQRLPARQRAALILHEVCGRSLAEVGEAIGSNPNAAKALIHRARARLALARGRTDVDPVADPALVERLVRAIETRSADAFEELLHPDVWGVTDGGALRGISTRPVHGARAVSRLWANANRRISERVAAAARRLNGEPAVVVTLPAAGGAVLAAIFIETREGRVAALRVVRDPRKLAFLEPGAARKETG